MVSRKRWDRIYGRESPFNLPQIIKQALATCAKVSADNVPRKVKYLWIYLDDTHRVGTAPEGSRKLGREGWLNVVDEAAALGAGFMIVSAASPLKSCPEIWKICQWAQSAHDMTVGIHFYGEEPCEGKLAGFDELDREKTKLFVDSKHIESCRFVEDVGFPVYAADGLIEETQRPCHLATTMTCVASEGTLYTCGLVLGREEFCLGDVRLERLDRIMEDKSLPRTIPIDFPDAPRRCDACPPLMVERLRSTVR